MAETPEREANHCPQTPFRLSSGLPPDERRTLRATWGAVSRRTKLPCETPSPLARRPSGDGPERALKGL
eukprot:6366458-Alexandrium_andersonii.AAC.1